MARYANQKTVVIHIQKPRKDKLFTVIEMTPSQKLADCQKARFLFGII